MNSNEVNTKRYRSYAILSLTGIAMSFVLMFTTWRYMFGESVLGVSTTQPDGGSQQFNLEQPDQQVPQQNGSPTQDQGQQQVSTPTTEITISNPTTEIIIENTNTELVITDVGSQTEIISVPGVPVIDPGTSGSTQPVQVPSTGQTTSPGQTVTSVPLSPISGSSQPTITSTLPGIITKSYPSYSASGTTGTSASSPSVTAKSPSMFTAVSNSLARPLSYIGIGTDAGSASMVPTDAVTIQYTPPGQTTNLDKWLRDYQFQVWAVGSDTIAIYQRGITTYTTDAIKLGLSKLSFKLVTDEGELPVLHYPYSVWTHLSAIHEISEDTHDQPIKLVSAGGTLRYLVHAHSRQYLLAAIPVSICRNLVVAVESGDILDSRACTKFDSALDTLSLRL